jgi:glycosyltransferase involved in cell wall biosynthesis
MPRESILFISTNDGPWGGSEELWSQTALRLAAAGFLVSASVSKWLPPDDRVLNLIEQGIEVWFRPRLYPLLKRALRALITPHSGMTELEVQRCLSARSPGLVVLSDGGPFPPIEIIELCVARKLPFVTIGQANAEGCWLDDDTAARYRKVLPAALRCYFVSRANLRLAEKQIGSEIANAEVVWNPVNVDPSRIAALPELGWDDELRLACVARLHPPSKGQDILLEALARPWWERRNWRLSLYGEGDMRNSLERMVHRLGLSSHVAFAGHRAVEEIWASNHVLVMPSRYEGLPLAMVEAMWCGRPVVATDVAGHSEVIEDGVTGFLADAPTVASMDNALQRFWIRRREARLIGAAAAKRIRQLVPGDPVQHFLGKLISNKPDNLVTGDDNEKIFDKAKTVNRSWVIIPSRQQR